ncbi:trigger factor [Williamsoniiplasma luminosum]|uniref:Trigger factor n=1 Tax=Williamsoniiplasma luminosum TaxID=214888 RepID=A0A2S0NJJ6_9MOLU|nr:trigger factor [Williamsoniiplasma luminosum]AVP49177.1 MAG: trigger factor [Williamsoniiplasma luminosum]
MKFKEEKLTEKGLGKWTVTIDGTEWTNTLKKAENRAKTELEIPGFRKGKAPESEVKKHLTQANIYKTAYRIAIKPAFDFAWEQKPTIEPMSSPAPNPVKIDTKELVIDFTFDLKPEIKIGKYTNITTVEKPKTDVTEEEVNDVITRYQDRFVMEKIREKNEKIQKGDAVLFDFKGFIDDVAFKGGELKNHKLVIGSKEFIPGFEDSMIGLGLGEAKIKVTFPQGYNEELQGKEAIFELNVHEITQRILPAADDELVKDLNLPDIKTIVDFKKKIKNDILTQKQIQTKQQFVGEIIDEIIKDSVIEFPKSAIEHQIKELKKDFEDQVIRKGLTLKDYKKATGLTDEMIEAEISEDAKLNLQTYLVRNEIKNIENITPTTEQIEQKYVELAKNFGVEEDYVKQILPAEQVSKELEAELLTNFLFDNNGKA